MPLCNYCSGISISACQHEHQPSFTALVQSAAGCDLCNLIMEVLGISGHRERAENYREHRDGKYDLVSDTSITISVNRHWKKEDEQPLQPYQLL